MALIVQKFGGSSVASVKNIGLVADKIVATRELGHDVVVVSSAMYGETDRLIQLSQQAVKKQYDREYDVLLASGEQVAVALIAMALIERGCPARSYTGSQAGIITDQIHTRARIKRINSDLLKADLNTGTVPVITGFQGISMKGDITTLGRGGSDTSAVAIAAALKADECQIFTDVDGVYSCDPHIVPVARRLDHVTFEEMLEMSSLGAKVLQLRAVEFAYKYNMPVRVVSTFSEGEGTLISAAKDEMEKPLVTSINCDSEQAKFVLLALPDEPSIYSEIVSVMSRHHFSLDMITHNRTSDDRHVDFGFTVSRSDYTRARPLLEKLAVKLAAKKLLHDKHVAKLSIVGIGIRSHVTITQQLFTLMAELGIPIALITTSEIKISIIIQAAKKKIAMQALHHAFGLDA